MQQRIDQGILKREPTTKKQQKNQAITPNLKNLNTEEKVYSPHWKGWQFG